MPKRETERRVFSLEFREQQDDDGGVVLEGYALKFDKASTALGFTEYLDRGCLDGADLRDVVALINHDANLPLGRTTVTEGAGALSLEVDDVGLKFRMIPTDTQYSRDLVTNMRAGVVRRCSFAFTLPDDEDAETWTFSTSGECVRHIKRIGKLWDVSIVTTPAYEDTEATASMLRARDAAAMEQEKAREVELLDLRAKTLKLYSVL